MEHLIKKLFPLSPEQQKRLALAKNVADSAAYYSAIEDSLQNGKYDPNIANKLATKLGSEWLNNHAPDIFPDIDEFEIGPDLVVTSTTHGQNERHSRMTMSQLGAWIDAQKQSHGI